jgi:hypothetical protein
MLIKAGEADPLKRTVYFDVRGNDGITPVNTENGQQPQLSIDGAAFGNAGISTLALIGNGRYSAVIDVGQLTLGKRILTRYKGAATAEVKMIDDPIYVVAFDPHDIAGAVDLKMSGTHGAGDWTGANKIAGTSTGPILAAIDANISAYVAVDFARTFQIENLDSSGWTQFVFTIKASKDQDEDERAILRLIKTPAGGAGDGLVKLDRHDVSLASRALGSMSVDASLTTRTIVNVNVLAAGMNFAPSPDSQPYQWALDRWSGNNRYAVGSGDFIAVRPVHRNPAAPVAAP